MTKSLLWAACLLVLGSLATTRLLGAQETQTPTDAPAILPDLTLNLFEADDKNIQYVGRVDFSDSKRPHFSAPGVYIRARFLGPTCDVEINDEMLWGKSHNYITIAVDDREPVRVQLTGKTNVIRAAYGLDGKAHTVTVCKDTESNIGALEFVGFRCQKLVPLPKPQPGVTVRRIEFYGDSITVGASSDTSKVACNKGEWYDQHNSYMAYGPRAARQLGAQWQVTAVSGIGLIHSCCDMKMTLPDVWDKTDLRQNRGPWDFKKYQPQVVTVCLGQNDGPQNAESFRTSYLDFLGKLRRAYPKAQLVCLSSPMGNATLTAFLKDNLTQVVNQMNAKGDKRVSSFFFSRSYNDGCGGHPDVAQHGLIANELTAYLKTLMKW